MMLIMPGPITTASLTCDDGTIYPWSSTIDAQGNHLPITTSPPFLRISAVGCQTCAPLSTVTCNGTVVPDRGEQFPVGR